MKSAAKPQPKSSDRNQRTWKTTRAVDVVVCPKCGRRNVNPKGNECMYCEAALDGTHASTTKCPGCGRANTVTGRNYCMYCGAGIGPNPRPFVFDENFAAVYSQIFNKETKPRFSDAFEHRVLQIIFSLLVLALLKIIFIDAGAENTHLRRQSILICGAILLLTIMMLLFYFLWHKNYFRK